MKNKKLLRLTLFGIEQTFNNKFWIILNVIMIIATIVSINFGTVKEIVQSSSDKTENEDLIKVILQDETGKLESKLLKEKMKLRF